MVRNSVLGKLGFFVIVVGATAVAGRWLSGSVPYLNASSPAISKTKLSTAKPSLKVLAESPSVSQAITSPSGPFEITFSQPINTKSLSDLQSSQPGSWKVLDSTTAVFVPSQPLMPESQLTITSVSGSGGKFAATNGDYLAKPLDLSWKAGQGSVLKNATDSCSAWVSSTCLDSQLLVISSPVVFSLVVFSLTNRRIIQSASWQLRLALSEHPSISEEFLPAWGGQQHD